MTPEHLKDAAVQTAQATPSVLVVLSSWLDVTPERWLSRCGIAFIALQAAYLVWKWRRDIRREKENRDESEAD
jgi:ABC-type nickel/cobalt efflux system permease component RcnA